MFVLFTLGLLSPFLTAHWDYAETVTAEVTRWDGKSKTYTESANASAAFCHFRESPAIEINMASQVHTRLVNSIMNQIVSDTAFYSAN